MKINKAAIWLALLLFCAFLILSLAFLAGHSDHDCAGPHCEICACLSAVRSRLQALAGAPVPAFAAFTAVSAALGLLARGDVILKAATPIALKVKLLD